MIPKSVTTKAEEQGCKYMYNDGTLHAVHPPESLFGYTVWSHMIPPFKPEHTLMLGYGNGTVAQLMRKIYGSCKITGVDLVPNTDYLEHKIKAMDAKEFIWQETKPAFKDYVFPKAKYDYVCIDLWNGDQVPAFIYDVEFAVRLREIATNLISMNIRSGDVPRTKNYHDYGYQYDRFVQCESNHVLWWSVYNEKKA